MMNLLTRVYEFRLCMALTGFDPEIFLRGGQILCLMQVATHAWESMAISGCVIENGTKQPLQDSHRTPLPTNKFGSTALEESYRKTNSVSRIVGSSVNELRHTRHIQEVVVERVLQLTLLHCLELIKAGLKMYYYS